MQVMNLGAQAAGPLTLAWDGKTADGTQAADGVYSVSVTALRGDQKVEAQTLAFGIVQAWSQGDQGVQLNVEAWERLGLADIKQIF